MPTPIPLWIILLDTSGSMGQPFNGERQLRAGEHSVTSKLATAIKAVERELSGLRDCEVALVEFKAEATLIVRGSPAQILASNRLRSLTAGGATNIAGALRFARDLGRSREQSGSVAVLLITDGISDVDESIRAAEDAFREGMRVFTILISPSERSRELALRFSVVGNVQPVSDPESLYEAVTSIRPTLLRRQEGETALLDRIRVLEDNTAQRISYLESRFSEESEERYRTFAELQERLVRQSNYQIDVLNEQVKKSAGIQQQLAELDSDYREWIWRMSLGLNVASMPMVRHVPVRIYIADPLPPNRTLDSISSAIIRIAKMSGFSLALEFPPARGSWWKRFFLKFKQIATHDEVISSINKVGRGLEATYLDKPQAEANLHQAQAFGEIADRLKEVHAACIQMGTLLVVKTVDPNGKVCVAAKTLTLAEMKRLEENQWVLSKPNDILMFLAPGTLSSDDQ